MCAFNISNEFGEEPQITGQMYRKPEYKEIKSAVTFLPWVSPMHT